VKAVVLEGENRLVFADVAEPEPVGDRPVLVRIGAVGVCGSDLLRVGQGTAYHYPLVVGHEFSAIVEQVPGDSPFARGDRVAVFPCLPDPRDPMTRIGEFVLGSGYDYFGSRRDGALQERLYVPESNLIPIPGHISLVHAALVEPAAVALHAMLKFRLPADATALVIGGGPIGALAAQWLRILGCSRVLVAEIDPRKRDIMAELGFEVIDAATVDTVPTVRELTAGRGVDCAVEASGLPKTVVQAVEVVATFGQVMLLGDIHGDVTLPAHLVSSILRREVTIRGTWNSKITPDGHSEWQMVLAHLDRDLIVAPLISHVLGFEDAPGMFGDMVHRRVWHGKVIFAVADEARSTRPDIASDTAATARVGARAGALP
jgi:L-iditol 2-dehydrogenase